LFFPKKGFLREEEEMEGSDGTREDTEDTTMLLQIEEVMSAIGALPIVTKLSPVGAHNGHGDWVGGFPHVKSCYSSTSTFYWHSKIS
jgi:hypothetical protein